MTKSEVFEGGHCQDSLFSSIPSGFLSAYLDTYLGVVLRGNFKGFFPSLDMP